MSSAPLPFFTVGHSTRPIADFVELLRAGQVQLVVDVRTVPRSRTNPQYNGTDLGASLAEYQIGYDRIASLGGLRKRVSEARPETNGWWTNQSFHNYADYAGTEPFERGLDELVALGRTRTVVIMCSEAVWWRCHRRIIADYLLARGETVFHLMGKDRVEQARLSIGAKLTGATIRYPAGRED